MYLNLLAYFSLSVWHLLLSSLNIQRYDSVLKILKILILLCEKILQVFEICVVLGH